MGDIFFTFETLDVYQKARRLVKDIYLLLDKFLSTEKYALCDQIKRAAVSIPSNLLKDVEDFRLKNVCTSLK